MIKSKITNRCQRIIKLVNAEASPIIIENEMRNLNEYSKQYINSYKEPTQSKFEIGSDEEHYEWVDYCITNGHIDLKEWRTIS